jgi:hypothetical protein
MRCERCIRYKVYGIRYTVYRMIHDIHDIRYKIKHKRKTISKKTSQRMPYM